ncbi:MAG: glutamine--fructose-6-phosphate transaminase (isomerizing), partial [Clostridia bacterium]|nr:glutamine--fructose-6-phosphate transaminase (isomerizing) [Clostridia bacterium]
MCGIIGYTGVDQAVPVLLDSLKKLEYRGYDSAGIAVVSEEGIRVEKTIGKVDCLVEKVKEDGQPEASCGIGHTRWATHGVPSDVNAHPHLSYDGRFAIVHNGIIENFAELKAMLMEKGIEFQSETDTEVIVQLLAYYYDGDTAKTLRKCVSKLEGSYALGVLSKEKPGTVYAARVASPLIIGLGADANYFASDITALVSHTKNVIDLDDGELAELTPNGVKVFDAFGNQIEKAPRRITWDVAAAEKSGYEHFMLKEIMEQPAALKATIEPRVKNEEVAFEDLDLDVKKFNRILITACGSAYHAGCVGKYVLEKLCRIPVEVDVASELRYRDPVIDEKTLTIAVSQSGETADTIAAIKECKAKGATTLAIVNVVGSS